MIDLVMKQVTIIIRNGIFREEFKPLFYGMEH